MEEATITAKPTQSINDVQIQALNKMQEELSRRFDKLDGKIDNMVIQLADLEGDKKLNNAAAIVAIGIALLALVFSIIAIIVAFAT